MNDEGAQTCQGCLCVLLVSLSVCCGIAIIPMIAFSASGDAGDTANEIESGEGDWLFDNVYSIVWLLILYCCVQCMCSGEHASLACYRCMKGGRSYMHTWKYSRFSHRARHRSGGWFFQTGRDPMNIVFCIIEIVLAMFIVREYAPRFMFDESWGYVKESMLCKSPFAHKRRTESGFLQFLRRGFPERNNIAKSTLLSYILPDEPNVSSTLPIAIFFAVIFTKLLLTMSFRIQSAKEFQDKYVCCFFVNLCIGLICIYVGSFAVLFDEPANVFLSCDSQLPCNIGSACDKVFLQCGWNSLCFSPKDTNLTDLSCQNIPDLNITAKNGSYQTGVWNLNSSGEGTFKWVHSENSGNSISRSGNLSLFITNTSKFYYEHHDDVQSPFPHSGYYNNSYDQQKFEYNLVTNWTSIYYFDMICAKSFTTLDQTETISFIALNLVFVCFLIVCSSVIFSLASEEHYLLVVARCNCASSLVNYIMESMSYYYDRFVCFQCLVFICSLSFTLLAVILFWVCVVNFLVIIISPLALLFGYLFFLFLSQNFASFTKRNALLLLYVNTPWFIIYDYWKVNTPDLIYLDKMDDKDSDGDDAVEMTAPAQPLTISPSSKETTL